MVYKGEGQPIPLAENYFSLSKADQKDALETAAGLLGLPIWAQERLPAYEELSPQFK